MTHENKKLWSPVAVSPVESCYLQWGRDIEGVKGGGGVISPQTEHYKHMEQLWEQTKCTSSFFMPHWEKKKPQQQFSQTPLVKLLQTVCIQQSHGPLK